jgi:transcriptional regulator PpsR
MNTLPNNFSRVIDSIDATAAAHLMSHVADAVFVINQEGVVENIFNHQAPGLQILKSLIGKSFIECATPESRKKITYLLDDLNQSEDSQKWRQINITLPDQADLPLMVSSIFISKENKVLAVGRDLRNLANLQQRLVEAQQAIETDYLRLRFAEARYRQLFDLSLTAHIIIDGSTLKVLEANPLALQLFSDKNQRVIGRAFAEFIDMEDFRLVQDLFNNSRNTASSKKIPVRLTKNNLQVELSANFLREENQTVFLIHVTPQSQLNKNSHVDTNSERLIRAVQSSADAFVVTDMEGKILTVNQTFQEMTQHEKISELIGESIDNWLGRSSIDLRIILNNLKDKTSIKHYVTSIIPRGLSNGIEVELSAVRVINEIEEYIGFSIRNIGQRVSQRNQNNSDLKQTATKLTELVGRVPLKDIVSETTDMIEKMCIMSALELTMNNRVSASEMLGLSRQSLYIKMRRFGITEPSGQDTD